MDFALDTYYPLFLFLIAVILFAVSALAACHLIGPRKKTPVKEMTYESGMDPIGDARRRFDVKFYLVAILFLVFDVELLFLYPWAASYQSNDTLPGESAPSSFLNCSRSSSRSSSPTFTLGVKGCSNGARSDRR